MNENVRLVVAVAFALTMTSAILFGMFDRLLRLACGFGRLSIPPLQDRDGSRIGLGTCTDVFLSLPRRLWLLLDRLLPTSDSRRLCLINSEPLCAEIREAYLSTLDEPLTRRRLHAYARRGSPKNIADVDRDGHATIQMVARRVRFARFLLVSPARPLSVGCHVCYEGDERGPTRLTLGMELWMSLLYRWTEKKQEITDEKELTSIGNHRNTILCCLGLVRSGVTHELVHLLQEVESGILEREYQSRLPNGASSAGGIRWHEWLRIEFEAHIYGSPEYLCILAAFLIPLIAWSAA